MADNDGRFPDESAVLVRYPLTREQEQGDRSAWPWLPGVVEHQGGPDEWLVTVYDPALAMLEDGSPAPEGTADEDKWFPQCFRDASELARECRHCGAPIRPCAHAGVNAPDYPLCKGWRHAGYDDQPVIGHCCEGRSVNPAAEPREDDGHV